MQRRESWDIYFYEKLLALFPVLRIIIEDLRFTSIANGKRQTQVENFSE